MLYKNHSITHLFRECICSFWRLTILMYKQKIIIDVNFNKLHIFSLQTSGSMFIVPSSCDGIHHAMAGEKSANITRVQWQAANRVGGVLWCMSSVNRTKLACKITILFTSNGSGQTHWKLTSNLIPWPQKDYKSKTIVSCQAA